MSRPSPSSSSSPPPLPPPQQPPPPPPPSSTTTKRLQPSPWSHDETVSLIQAYQEKWYSLKRGQLKSNQWEEVAAVVSARCGYDSHSSQSAKTALQCRHKMEKLRRRYREEKRRMSLGGACFWQYYKLMDALECGSHPISARPVSAIPHVENHQNATYKYNVDQDDDDDDDDDVAEEEEEEEEDDYGYISKSRSINYIIRKPVVDRSRHFAAVATKKKRKREEMVVAEEEEKGELGSGLAAEIREFAKRMMGMERKKMEMVKETERWRMEMENKRMEMILGFQEKLVNSINNAFGSQKDL